MVILFFIRPTVSFKMPVLVRKQRFAYQTRKYNGRDIRHYLQSSASAAMNRFNDLTVKRNMYVAGVVLIWLVVNDTGRPDGRTDGRRATLTAAVYSRFPQNNPFLT